MLQEVNLRSSEAFLGLREGGQGGQGAETIQTNLNPLTNTHTPQENFLQNKVNVNKLTNYYMYEKNTTIPNLETQNRSRQKIDRYLKRADQTPEAD